MRKKRTDPEKTQDRFFDYLTNLIQTENLIEEIADSSHNPL